MPLDADAQAVADMAQAVPPFHVLGIDGARELTGSAKFPPPQVEIAQVNDRTLPTAAGSVPVRLYHPNPGTDLPVLMYMHGGGWATGGPWTSDATCRVLAERAECVVVSVDYRLAPEHRFPAAFHDACGAAEWLAESAAEIGGDPHRLAIGGDSAGANLAAAVCVHARHNNGPRFVFQLLVYPTTEYAVERPSWVENAEAPMLCTKDVVWFWDQYLASDSDRTDPRATPSNAESLADLPPAFVITAEYDPIRDDGEAYGQALADAGVPVTVTRYPGVFHGFFSMPMLARAQQAFDDAADHLVRAFSVARQPRPA